MANILKMGVMGLTAGYLISESNGMYRSRTEGAVLVSADAGPGTIMGRLVAGTATATAKVGNTGNATSSAVTVNDDAVAGDYKVVFTSPTAFNVLAPGGAMLAPGTTGVAYAGHLGFTLTVGATPMAIGDTFTMKVTATKGQFVPHVIGGSGGAQTVSAILWEGAFKDVPVQRTLTVRDCEVLGAHLIYPAGATNAQKVTINAALLALGIVVR